MQHDLNLQNADDVIDTLRAGAEANRTASCRAGSIDLVRAPGRLLATGDLHDNPVHFARVVHAAGLGSAPGIDDAAVPESSEPAHLTLHELIHSDRLMNGMDFSYRALTRVAALKADHPEHVHTLLANHELAQIVGAGIIKHGVRVVQAFDDAIDYAFSDDADRVRNAIGDFVRSMPIALRCVCPQGDILCAHSVPGPAMMGRFDPSILERELTDDDYAPRVGSAHFMVWGRGYDADLLEDLTERWGINLFILGHEHAETGCTLIEPNAVVLNSDHERGVYLPIDLDHKPRLEDVRAKLVPLASPSEQTPVF
ncbi:MAG: metallophosphoesterase [Planctomycetota bacterium]